MIDGQTNTEIQNATKIVFLPSTIWLHLSLEYHSEKCSSGVWNVYENRRALLAAERDKQTIRAVFDNIKVERKKAPVEESRRKSGYAGEHMMMCWAEVELVWKVEWTNLVNITNMSKIDIEYPLAPHPARLHYCIWTITHRINWFIFGTAWRRNWRED